MALAMRSFPGRVSPSMRTVESVEATCFTCSRTDSRAALAPTILGEILSQGSSPSNPVFAGNPAGISKDALRFRASLIKLVCADILLLPSFVHGGFDVHRSPFLSANFRLVLCRFRSPSTSSACTLIVCDFFLNDSDCRASSVRGTSPDGRVVRLPGREG